jgi:uncharacterized membrane protein
MKEVFLLPLPLAVAGLVFLFCGWMMRVYPPVWPNVWYGYRTPKSLKTKELFDAGNVYSARLLRTFGPALILIAIVYCLLVWVLKIDDAAIEKAGVFVAGFVAVPILFSIIPLIVLTERHLARIERGEAKSSISKSD